MIDTPTLAEVAAIIDLMRERGVMEFSFRGITAKLDVTHGKPMMEEADFADLEKKHAMERFKQTAADEGDALFWSSDP